MDGANGFGGVWVDGGASTTTINFEPTPRQQRIAFLQEYRPVLMRYLKAKFDAEDWHGVQDAASDLRDLDCELDGLSY
jgi:hypothetical protein